LHHFASKDELGVAAAQYWSDVTGPLFAKAESLANYMQTVLQGGLRAVEGEGRSRAFTRALAHLKYYGKLLFNKETLQ
jgi:AcrR family transcriptional regulator